MAGLSGNITIGTATAIYGINQLNKALEGTLTTGINFNAKMASASVGLTTALEGNSKAAQALMKDLRAFADISPFQMDEVTPLAQKLLAMQIPLKDLNKTLHGIGNQTAALGAGADVFNRISLAMGQMNLKGQVMSQDLRQLAEAGVPAVEYLARSWKVSTEQMKGFIQQGIVPGKLAVRALAEQMDANNFDAMRRQSLELGGALSTLRDNFKFLAANELQDTYSGLTNVVNRLNVLSRDEEVTSWIHNISTNFRNGFGVVWDTVKWFTEGFKTAFEGIGSLLDASGKGLATWGKWLWDGFKEAAKGAAWFVDKTTWLTQKAWGGEGDFFSKNLEKSIGNFEAVASKGAGKVGSAAKEIADTWNETLGQAWRDTWGSMPDFGSKWDAAGKKVEDMRKKALGPRPKVTDFSGQFMEDAEKAARARLKGEKDALADLAKAYETKAQSVIKSAQRELDIMRDLKAGYTDTFSTIQSAFVSLGVIDDPLGPMLKGFEKLLDLGGRSKTVVEQARLAYGNFNGAAIAARSEQERLNGLDTYVPTKGGGLASGSLGIAPNVGVKTVGGGMVGGSELGMVIARAAERMQGRAATFVKQCDRLADTTVNSVTTAFNKIMGPRSGDTAARTMARFMAAGIGFAATSSTSYAAGDIVYSGATKKNSAGHVMIVGTDGRFYDQYTGQRGAKASRPTTRPDWVVRAGGAPSNTTAAPRGGVVAPLAGIKKVSDMGAIKAGFNTEGFDLSALDGSLTSIAAVDKAWGKAVKNTGENSTKFALQTRLASVEFQTQIEAAALRTGKTVPEIVKWLRQLGEVADQKLNRVTAVDSVTASLKELAAARKLVGQEKNPLAGILADFEKDGKYANAPDLRNKLLDAQVGVNLANVRNATKLASEAERDRIKVLSEAKAGLSALTIGTNAYEIALERANRKFEVWRNPDLTGLLKTATTYDELGGKALKMAAETEKAAKIIRDSGFDFGLSLILGTKAADQKAEGEGFKGRAAGIRREANETAGTRIKTGDTGAEYQRATDREKADLQARFEYKNRIQSLRKEGVLLQDLTLSETLRERKISRQNFALNKQIELMRTGTEEGRAKEIANDYANSEGVISRLEKRNEVSREYLQLIRETKKETGLNKALAGVNLAYLGADDRALAIAERRAELNRERIEKGQSNTTFRMTDKIRLFANNYDSKQELEAARELRGLTRDNAQAIALFGDESAVAGIKWRTSFGDLKDQSEVFKRNIIEATASLARTNEASETLRESKSRVLDLQKSIESTRISLRNGGLSDLQTQELDWKYQDMVAFRKDGLRDPQMQRDIDQERASIRALMREAEGLTKIGVYTDRVTSEFGSMYDSILSRQESFGGALVVGVKNILADMAKEVILSEARAGLLSLFGGVLGGGGGKSVAAAGTGVSVNAGNGGAGFNYLGSFAVGIDRVPRDGFAKIHKDEMIIPAARAHKAREQRAAQLSGARSSSSGAGGGTTIIVNNYTHSGDIKTNDPTDYQRQLQSRARQANNRPVTRSSSELARQARLGLSR